MNYKNYNVTIGIETHIELNTQNKIFCSCKNRFGSEANTNICPICTAMPGVLPHFNKQVAQFAVVAGLSLNCKINNISSFDRKNYFYPDLPKGYQITQQRNPICENGYLRLKNNEIVEIERIHMEEDAGKITNSENGIYVDFNRCGVPLLEIVTKPCITSSQMAAEYCTTLQNQISSLKISDCKMEQGSLRCDVNISIKKPEDNNLGTKVELKNLNSFSNMVKAIEYEILRQGEILDKGEKVAHQTRKFDVKTGKTISMRTKEDSGDYRYFPEPNLKDYFISDEEIIKIKNNMPLSFLEKIDLLIEKYQLSYEKSEKVAKFDKIYNFFILCLNSGADKDFIYNMIFDVMFSQLKTQQDREDFSIFIDDNDIIKLYHLIKEKKITTSKAKELIIFSFNPVFNFKEELKKIESCKQLSTKDIEKICCDIISQNEKAVNDYINGKEKAIMPLVGMAVKQTNGAVNPKEILKIIKSVI